MPTHINNSLIGTGIECYPGKLLITQVLQYSTSIMYIITLPRGGRKHMIHGNNMAGPVIIIIGPAAALRNSNCAAVIYVCAAR